MFVIASGSEAQRPGERSRRHWGIGAGSLFHAAAAAVGVSAVIAASPLAFDAMRIVGALYLAWLGIQAIRAFMSNTGSGPGSPTGGRRSAGSVSCAGSSPICSTPR